MANPLDMVMQDQSVEPDDDGVRRVVIRSPGALAPDLGAPTGNALAQAVAPEQPSELTQGLAALKDYVLNGQFSPGTKVGNRLFGTGGEERYQMWPERMVRSALSAPGDALASTADNPVTSENAIAPAQDIAGMVSGSTLFAKPGADTLGSGPLRPGANAVPVEPAPVFYSALEHAATNAAQDTMSAPQWLGYLKNQPGVKKEELDWSGLEGWLGAQKGKVKKEDVQAYLDAHKTEIKDVTKEEGGLDLQAVPELVEENMEGWRDQFREEHGRDPTHSESEIARVDFEDDIHNNPDQYKDLGLESTKYSSYQLPGGENYREHLLTMPYKPKIQLPEGWSVGPSQHVPEQFSVKNEKGEQVGPNYDTPERAMEKHNLYKGNQDYKSSHWDEPNVLAHVRTNDRDVGGKKSLHIEEIQSDWHQQGRKQGYADRDPALKEKAEQARKDYQDSLPVVHTMIENNNNFGYRDMPEAMRKMRDLGPDVAFPRMTEEQSRIALKAYDAFNDANNLANKVKGGVPDAPFKSSDAHGWPGLALKRMIRHAAENGYDRISWTPGEAQAARYDLSKTFNNIIANKLEHNGQTAYSLTGVKKGDSHNTSTPMGPLSIPEAKLADYVGKDLAEKIAKQDPGVKHYEGVDLKVGGEGMREFYDKMLPKIAEKIGKAHGVKVKQTNLNESPYKIEERGDRWFVRDNTGSGILFKTEKEARKWAEKVAPVTQPVHYFDLPQSLKDHAVGRGFPLYMSGLPFPLQPVDYNPFEKKGRK